VISVAAELVDRTIDEFGRCGAGLRECVVYWLADRSEPGRVVDVVHPLHTATSFGYSVDGGWLNEFFFGLADDGRTAVAQVHTHPGRSIDHSETDDEFVLVPSPDFVSIVVPDFGATFRSDRCAVHVLEASGAWRVDPTAVSW
jgi:hypothetical protein